MMRLPVISQNQESDCDFQGRHCQRQHDKDNDDPGDSAHVILGNGIGQNLRELQNTLHRSLRTRIRCSISRYSRTAVYNGFKEGSSSQKSRACPAHWTTN